MKKQNSFVSMLIVVAGLAALTVLVATDEYQSGANLQANGQQALTKIFANSRTELPVPVTSIEEATNSSVADADVPSGDKNEKNQSNYRGAVAL